jgi:hypothetical protein
MTAQVGLCGTHLALSQWLSCSPLPQTISPLATIRVGTKGMLWGKGIEVA